MGWVKLEGKVTCPACFPHSTFHFTAFQVKNTRLPAAGWWCTKEFCSEDVIQKKINRGRVIRLNHKLFLLAMHKKTLPLLWNTHVCQHFSCQQTTDHTTSWARLFAPGSTTTDGIMRTTHRCWELRYDWSAAVGVSAFRKKLSAEARAWVGDRRVWGKPPRTLWQE